VNKAHRIAALSALGKEIQNYLNAEQGAMGAQIQSSVEKAALKNRWFVARSSQKMLSEIAAWLQKDELESWLDQYELADSSTKTVAVIGAGNIPMVAFHDVLCVLASGANLAFKASSEDEVLMKMLIDLLIEIEPKFADKIAMVENLRNLKFDAIIATGSNNSSRYFEHYFSKYPHIIRKNRNGIAVLNGEETKEEIELLGEDIFSYYGLGCRSISKLHVPKGYDFDKFYKHLFDFKWVMDNKAYYDNYEYNKTVYLLNNEKLLDNGFLLLKEDGGISSPVGVMFWEPYDSADDLKQKIKKYEADTQCVIGSDYASFGSGQEPSVNDYADNVDAMTFLSNLLTAEGL